MFYEGKVALTFQKVSTTMDAIAETNLHQAQLL